MDNALPTLTGTAKQIAYANDLRAEHIADLTDESIPFDDDPLAVRTRAVKLHMWRTETSAAALIKLATTGLPFSMQLAISEQVEKDVAAFDKQWEQEHPAAQDKAPARFQFGFNMTPEQKAQRRQDMAAERASREAREQAKSRFLADRYQQSLDR